MTVPQEEPASGELDAFTRAFHAGGRPFFEALYREHFGTVEQAVSRVVQGVDRETVIHDVFMHLMIDENARRSFRGGSFGSWLSRLSRNRAIDFLRHRGFEVPVGMDPWGAASPGPVHDEALDAEARIVVEEFRRRVLPPQWARVFEARFLRQLDQHTAARELGMRRTTLAYQEYRIRGLLRRFVLGRRLE